MKSKFFLLIIFIFFLSARPARAFEISPIKMLVTADSATNQTVVLKIKNSAKTDSVFLLNVFGMRQDNAGLPIFERGISPAEPWIFPEDNSITIKAGETKSANFIIKIPENTSPGSYYVGLAAEPSVDKNSQKNINTRLVSLLTLQVSGLATEAVLIEKWEKINNGNNESWQFNLNLKNNGSVEVPMQGLIAIKNYKGDEIFAEQITVGNKLLAESKRALMPLVSLKDRVKLPGLYQAQIKLKYGKTNQEVSAIAYIWYFPGWSKIIIAVFIVILALLLVLRLRKKAIS
jgi:hypothetical protein